jgi:bifunctional DNA-binding transcriptional regulator/antitoxin component of YhaV-PrlF toxin-antitoxin module
MIVRLDEGWSMAAEAARAVVEATVTPNGDLVVPSSAVRRLSLVPGQHVQVIVDAPVRRDNMYGVLAGRLPGIAPEEIARVRGEAWGDLARGQ